MILQIIAIIILLMLSAYFSSAETALTTVNPHSMRAMAEDGNKKAAIVLKLIENPSQMLSSVLVNLPYYNDRYSYLWKHGSRNRNCCDHSTCIDLW